MDDSEYDRKRKRYLTIQYIRFGLKVTIYVAKIVFILCMIPLLQLMAGYIGGDEIMENPLTNSQITAMMITLLICYAIYIVNKAGKR